MANEHIDPIDEEKLESYVVQMTTLQKKISDIQKELSQITEDAKIDGFDLQALKTLVQIRTQHSSDLGQRVLTNLTKYAHMSGTPLEVVVERQAAGPTVIPSLVPNWDESYEKQSGSAARLFVTAAWGVLVAVSLLWLLT